MIRNRQCSVVAMKIVLLTFMLESVNGQEKMLGAAEVRVNQLELCPDFENDPFALQWTQRKLNRTTEAWSGNMSFDVHIGEGVWLYANAAKKVDGGWKPNAYQLNHSNVCEFLMEYGGDNFKKVLIEIGVEPECPVPPGSYSLKDYVVDYDSLPQTLLYGEFRIEAQVMLDDGPGLWIVRNMEMCPDNDQYESSLKVIRKKINRTHDGFTYEYQLATDINTEAAVRLSPSIV
ncbi:hypothetical protein EVAR_41266_1 [Eumeta japonica]|uniref:Uncharacterized protein n=1 Tax=Eumeta variegata TaxID=151549 RepID=A0A4C1XC21_EUMVA|nr:hypothetical protein EVAR_41266_1 [Eumeta japonica]